MVNERLRRICRRYSFVYFVRRCGAFVERQAVALVAALPPYEVPPAAYGRSSVHGQETELGIAAGSGWGAAAFPKSGFLPAYQHLAS